MQRFLLIALLGGCAFAASAQPPVANQASAPDGASASAAKDAATDEFSRLCLRQTGSRIVAAQNAHSRKGERRCVAANGHSYSKADLDRTGQFTLAEALRRLEPAIH